MGSEFLEYLDRLQLLAFFCGFPLVYASVRVADGAWKNWKKRPRYLPPGLSALLPPAYALAATLYFGMILHDMIQDPQHRFFGQSALFALYKIWAVLALLFWIPVLQKNPLYSLLHSLLFLLLLVYDIWTGMQAETGREALSNDMGIYTNSLILHAITFLIVFIGYLIKRKFRR